MGRKNVRRREKDSAEKHVAEKRLAASSPEPAPAKASHGAMDHRQFLLISKALADPTRTSVLRSIAAGQGACSGMRVSLGVSAATLSHHIKELEHAGLVTLSRDGRFVHAELDRKLWKKYIGELKSLAH